MPQPGPKIDDEYWFVYSEKHVSTAQERRATRHLRSI
jgi:hypothetical protein